MSFEQLPSLFVEFLLYAVMPLRVYPCLVHIQMVLFDSSNSLMMLLLLLMVVVRFMIF